MPAPLIAIQTAQLAQIPALLDLLKILFELENDFVFDAIKAERGLLRLLERDNALVLIAETNGTVIGMCSVQTLISTAEGGEVGLVEDLVVAENWRSCGVGHRLLQAAESWALGRGLTRLQLLADSNNTAALAFYQRVGWADTQLVCRRRMLC